MTKNRIDIDIKSINDPNIVKKLNYEELNSLCASLRTEIINATSLQGGHLSSNLGVVELIVALYRSFNFPIDKLIFDTSHQCYAHKILTGRFLDTLNLSDGVSGFCSMNESKYDCYEAGHSSTALSAAQAFAIARDLNKANYDVVALVGDASLANGLSFEALNNISNHKNKVIIVINDNGMSISKATGGLSRFFRKISTAKSYNKFKSHYRKTLARTKVGQGIYHLSFSLKTKIKHILIPLTLFDNMGFTYIGPVDGHNIKAMEKAFKRAKNTNKSVVIHVKTIKGKGYSYAENDLNGYWHGVTPFVISNGAPINTHPGFISWSNFIGEEVHRLLGEDSLRLLICPAMVKGSHLEDSFKDYPSRCYDVGIAEEHALTLAGAFSLNGFHPIVSIYSTFLQRAYDELLHDCARINSDLTLLIDRAGLVGKDGSTHMGIYDEAYLKSIPYVSLAMPATFAEARALLKLSLKPKQGVFALRYPHTLMSVFSPIDDEEIEYGCWKFIKYNENNKVSVIAVGPEGLELLRKLERSNHQFSLISALFLNPLPNEHLIKLLGSEQIVVYDPYGTETGFSESVSSALLKLGYHGSFKSFAIKNAFIPHGERNEQAEKLGVDIDSVYKKIVEEFC